MDKKYQIFISSTFVDLVEERQNVIKSVLELEHMPAGMELFPATDDSSWDLIKDVIDASDYYLLIIGGRYGSTDKEGIGYTEKEYDYAVSKKKAVIPLLHKDPDAIPAGKTEKDPELLKKLVEFRKKIESKHSCVYWADADGLQSQVILGVTKTIKRKPAIGWVKADLVPKESTLKEILQLKSTISDLENKIAKSNSATPENINDLAQGKDKFTVEVTLKFYKGMYAESIKHKIQIDVSWDYIFVNISPCMINEIRDFALRKKIENFLGQVANFCYEHPYKELNVDKTIVANHYIDTIIIQLRALCLIKESIKKRSIQDTSAYWTLTSLGDERMVRLRALKKEDAKEIEDF